jgi:hypothetical protein
LAIIVARGLKTVELVRTDLSGSIRWTVTLAGLVEWSVLVDRELVIAVPVRVDPSSGWRGGIEVFSLDGGFLREVPWAVPLTGWDGVQELATSGGVVVGDLNTGQRISARIDPKSTADPDDIVTVGDLAASGEGPREERKRDYRAGVAVLGARPVDMGQNTDESRKLNFRRQKRLGALRGHKLLIRGLPGYDRSAADKEISRGDWWKPETALGRVVSIEPDGSMWVTFSIHNPYHLSQTEMNVLDDRRDARRMGKAGVALFAPDGHLRGYMLSDCLVRPVTGAAYLECGGVLMRVEPVPAR